MKAIALPIRFRRAFEQAGKLLNWSQLCLTHSRQARRLGIWLLSKCAADNLFPMLIATATASQLELLLLEASLRLHEPRSSAILHIGIFQRVEEIGEPIQTLLQEEIRIQALNTHGYREAIRVYGGDYPKLIECVRHAEEAIDTIIRAAKSPAVRMQIPGRVQAEAAAFRRFSREVQSAAEKYSPFGNMNQFFGATVHLLYSKKWRHYNGGVLSDVSEITRSEVSTEMPRLEFTRPEDMRMRRIKAAIRIAELQNQTGADGI